MSVLSAFRGPSLPEREPRFAPAVTDVTRDAALDRNGLADGLATSAEDRPEKRGSPKAGTLRLRGKGLHLHATHCGESTAPTSRRNTGTARFAVVTCLLRQARRARCRRTDAWTCQRPITNSPTGSVPMKRASPKTSGDEARSGRQRPQARPPPPSPARAAALLGRRRALRPSRRSARDSSANVSATADVSAAIGSASSK